MTKINNKVIVWSIDDFNTLGLMRELGNSELDLLFLVKGKAGFACRSKYCKEYYETETIEEGYNYIINNFSNAENKPILIISSDEIITYVDQHKDEIEKYCIAPGTSKKGNIEKYIDKNTMTGLAKEIGILCPDSRKVMWDSSIEGVEYPCIIKPSHQKPGHYNEFKTRICKNVKQLKKTLKLVRHDSEFILQKFIPKELDLLIYGGRMRDGNTVFAGAMIRDRWAYSGSSSHGYLTQEIPPCIDTSLLIDFLDIIDYYGLFSFEFGLVGDRAYFFEVNLRNDGTSHYFYQAGANIPLAYVYSCVNQDYKMINTKVNEKRWFIDEVFDIENVIKKRITKQKWQKDLNEATIYKYYDEDDPEPSKMVRKGMKKQIMQDFMLTRFRPYIVFVLDKFGIGK